MENQKIVLDIEQQREMDYYLKKWVYGEAFFKLLLAGTTMVLALYYNIWANLCVNTTLLGINFYGSIKILCILLDIMFIFDIYVLIKYIPKQKQNAQTRKMLENYQYTAAYHMVADCGKQRYYNYVLDEYGEKYLCPFEMNDNDTFIGLVFDNGSQIAFKVYDEEIIVDKDTDKTGLHLTIKQQEYLETYVEERMSKARYGILSSILEIIAFYGFLFLISQANVLPIIILDIILILLATFILIKSILPKVVESRYHNETLKLIKNHDYYLKLFRISGKVNPNMGKNPFYICTKEGDKFECPIYVDYSDAMIDDERICMFISNGAKFAFKNKYLNNEIDQGRYVAWQQYDPSRELFK